MRLYFSRHPVVSGAHLDDVQLLEVHSSPDAQSMPSAFLATHIFVPWSQYAAPYWQGAKGSDAHAPLVGGLAQAPLTQMRPRKQPVEPKEPDGATTQGPPSSEDGLHEPGVDAPVLPLIEKPAHE